MELKIKKKEKNNLYFLLILGPKGLPLLGYVPFIKKHDSTYLYKGFMKMSEIYGPVVGFYMGPRQACVSVCDYDAVKEVLHSEDFSGRFDTNLIKLRTFGQRLGKLFRNSKPVCQFDL